MASSALASACHEHMIKYNDEKSNQVGVHNQITLF